MVTLFFCINLKGIKILETMISVRIHLVALSLILKEDTTNLQLLTEDWFRVSLENCEV